jgi:hypothetical protein
MIDAWLGLPVWAVFVGLVAGFSATAALAVLVAHRGPLARALRHVGKVEGVAFASIAVLFSLLTGFLANGVWERNAAASRTVMNERAALLTLANLAVATPADMTLLYAGLKRYIAAVPREWQLMRDQQSFPEADAALDDLMRELTKPQHAQELGDAVQGAIIDAALSVRAARAERLALSVHNADTLKWLSVLILLGLAQLALVTVHLHSLRASVVTVALFTLAATITLGFVAIRERPFDGPLRLSPHPILQVVQMMEAARLAQPGFVMPPPVIPPSP